MEKNTQVAQELEKCQRQVLDANAELEKFKASPGIFPSTENS